MLLGLVLTFLTVPAQAAGLYLGMTRRQAEEAMGGPGNYLERGSKGMLTYPDEVTLRFVDGRLVAAEGVEIFQSEAEASAAPRVRRLDEKEQPAKQGSVKKTPKPVAPTAPAEAATQEAPAPAETPVDPLAQFPDDNVSDSEYIKGVLEDEFGKEATGLAMAGEASPGSADEPDESSPGMDDIQWYFVFLIDLAIAYAALRLACKFAGAEVLTPETLLVAFIDALAAMGAVFLTQIPDWGEVLNHAKIQLILPLFASAIAVPLFTSAKSLQSVISVVGGMQFIKVVFVLILLNLAVLV